MEILEKSWQHREMWRKTVETSMGLNGFKEAKKKVINKQICFNVILLHLFQ